MKNANHHNSRLADCKAAAILALISARPMTAQQLADELGVSRSNISTYTRRLFAEPRQIYVSGHVPGKNGRSAPLYAAGNKPDVEVLCYRKPKQVDRAQSQRERLLVVLAEPGTTEQIAEKMFLTVSRVRTYVRELRLAKQAYIKGWKHPGHRGDLAPIYALGSHKDKAKPKETRAQRYKKEIVSKEKRERVLALKRTSYHLSKAKARPNTWLNILGGAA